MNTRSAIAIHTAPDVLLAVRHRSRPTIQLDSNHVASLKVLAHINIAEVTEAEMCRIDDAEATDERWIDAAVAVTLDRAVGETVHVLQHAKQKVKKELKFVKLMFIEKQG